MEGRVCVIEFHPKMLKKSGLSEKAYALGIHSGGETDQRVQHDPNSKIDIHRFVIGHVSGIPHSPGHLSRHFQEVKAKGERKRYWKHAMIGS